MGCHAGDTGQDESGAESGEASSTSGAHNHMARTMPDRRGEATGNMEIIG
jgi:hypothetical protein